MDHILSHIREIKENLLKEDLTLLDAMKKASISYCSGQTGLDEDQLDLHEDITIAVLCMISDMWDNRSASTNSDKRNKTVDIILAMHSENLLPTPNEEMM